jgi:NAD-dependent deacetylase
MLLPLRDWRRGLVAFTIGIEAKMEPKLAGILGEVRNTQGNVLALTGAGISAESGIPTFRGSEGYWVVGSRNYMPQEMATQRMFRDNPEEVWRWYLYRFSICREAKPNEGHKALVKLDRALQERFLLVTQNIDGLHRRAGSSRDRTYCIHGDFSWIRCASQCTQELLPMPDFPARGKDSAFKKEDREKLTCPHCKGWLRPHVLWFDEYYDETYYRMNSSLRAAQEAAWLLVVGTSGATNLPMQIGSIALQCGAAVVDVNPAENPFSRIACSSPKGFFAQGTACERLPEIVEALI